MWKYFVNSFKWFVFLSGCYYLHEKIKERYREKPRTTSMEEPTSDDTVQMSLMDMVNDKEIVDYAHKLMGNKPSSK